MGLLLLMSFGSSQAQLLGGIFSQGATELGNNAAQIAALAALDKTNQEDYDVLDTGLTAIGDIHGAEYMLHQQYFASLGTINPAIAGLPEIKEINSMAAVLSTTLTAAINGWVTTGGLTPAELNALTALDTGLSGIGQVELKALQTLLTPGELTMSDAERIEAIRQIDKAVHTQYEFMEQVCAEAALLVANRKKS